MSTIPNRLQKHWPAMRAFLKREWPQLTEADLDAIDGRYDRLLDRLYEVYRTGAEIMLEAPVKDRLQRYLNQLEAMDQAS